MSNEPGMHTAEDIQNWLITRLAELLYLETSEIDVQEPFHSYGLSSREAVSLSGDLEEWLGGRSLSPTVLWDYPSIATLAQYLTNVSHQMNEPASVQPHTVGHLAHEPIAIIGIGCRFPGASGPEEFWKLLRNGIDAISEVDETRWDSTQFYDPDPSIPGKMNTRWGGFLKQVDQFDAHFFGISPREAEVMDPQQRLLLEVTWEALEDAGQDTERLSGSETGVFIGIATNDYSRSRLADPALIDAYAGTGSAFSIAANRISYFFNWYGPSMAVDTACSSSLVAVHLACQSLWQEEATMALAGGVNLVLEPTYAINFTKAGAMSPDGRCKTFDESANGYVRGEGVGVIVLKPLKLAMHDGDSIYAVIRGSAVNQDGKTNGLMAPSRQAQEKVLQQAYRRAAVSPSQIQYVEAHGTGTLLGDPIEVQALGNVLSQGRPTLRPCALGSVKTNIGHLEAAAGIAGIIKVALSMKQKLIPPSLHFKRPNPHIPFDKLPLYVQTTVGQWASDVPTLAGVSSFGFGGTNAHVVLEEAPTVSAVESTPESSSVCLLPLSARSPGALHKLARVYYDFLETQENAQWSAICASACIKRTHFEHRLALVAASINEARESLSIFLLTGQSPEVTVAQVPNGTRQKIVFVFPGQGSQWLGMGRQLFAQEPVFRHCLEACEQAMRSFVSWSLVPEILAEGKSSRFDEIDIIQPVLFAIEVALAELWRSWGIIPDAVVGHSMGEVAAAYIAGALSLTDACRIICERSRLLRHMSRRGAMLAIDLSLDQTRLLIRGYEEQVSIAVNNGPDSTVLSGAPETLQQIYQRLWQRDVFCRWVKVDVASHSPQMEPLRTELTTLLADLQPQSTQMPFYSTVFKNTTSGEDLGAEYWGLNLRQPVWFAQTVGQLLSDGYEIFLEVSPHPILLPSIEQALHQGSERGIALCSLKREQDERRALLLTQGVLYTRGYQPHWLQLVDKARACVSLPTYPWQHQRYWIDVNAPPYPLQSSTGITEVRTTTASMQANALEHAVTPILVALANQEVEQQRLLLLEAHIREHVAQILRMSLSEIEINIPLMALGFDSITALELKKRLQSSLVMTLPTTLIWQYPTIQALATYLCQNITLPFAQVREHYSEY